MAFNVVDFQNFIRSFMIDKIKNKYPEIDASDNSAFDDLFIKPMIEVVLPLIETLNSLEFKMNLENAEYMSEEDLDDVGENNYLIPRKRGQQATAIETLSFSKVSSTDNLIIPAGIIFETESGLQFQLMEKKEFTPSELMTKYNASTMSYDVDINIIATEVGEEYNVTANQITVIPNKFNPYLISVTNKADAIAGINKEDNISYASRVRDFYISRHIGTKPGYKQFILENFTEVQDVYIAGHGDPEMTRDFLTMLLLNVFTNATTLFLYHHGLISDDAIVNTTRSSSLTFVNVTDVNRMTHSSIANQAAGDAIKKFKKQPNKVAEAGTTTTSLKITGHGLSNGDYIRNMTRSGAIRTVTVTDVDTLSIAAITDQVASDNIELYKFLGNSIAYDGIQDVHIGGKIDLYIKGCEYGTYTASVVSRTPTLQLSEKNTAITPGSITVQNVDDPLKTPIFTTTVDDSDNCIVTLNNTGNQSYDPTTISQIKVAYTYLNGSAQTVPKEDTFNVGITKTTLESPFKSIVAIVSSTNPDISYNTTTYYDIIRTDIEGKVIDANNIFAGTTQENITIILKNMDTVVNGTTMNINYTVNDTLKGLKDNFDIEENRIVTTDLLFKEATPIFVNVGFDIKMRSGQTLDDIKIARINGLLAEYFNKMTLGGRAEESDIVGFLYKDDEVNKFMEFVSLPFKSFYIPTSPTDPIINQRDNTFIAASSIQYPVLNKTNILSLT